MQFINSIFLIGLLAIAIPIIIHLLKNRKVQKLWLGSLRFLIEAQKSKRRRKNIKELLLLITRCLILLILVALFLRPYLGSKQDYSKTESSTVILVDVSGSMTGNYNSKSMFEAEKDKVEELIKELQATTNITIAAFSDDIYEVQDIKDLKIASGTGTNYGKAIKWAQNKLMNGKKKQMDIIMLTDMQISGLPSDAITEWSNLINFHLYPILPSGKNNIGINNVIIPKAFAGTTHHLFPELNISGDEESIDNVQLLINGKKQNVSKFSLEKGLEWTPEKSGWYEGEVILENSDSWQFDNKYYFRTYVNALKSVLLVNGYKGESKYTDASYYVEKAFLANENAKNKSINTKVTNQFLQEKEDLVVFCDVNELNTQEVEKYKTYLEDGGTALFFLGNKMNENKMNSLFVDDVFPVKIDKLADTSTRPILKWNSEHDALKLFNNRNNGDISSIIFSEVYQLTPHTKATVLASLNNGNPAIVEMNYGKGKMIVVANSASRELTDWPISRMFLPIVRELSYYLIGLSESKENKEPEICSLLKNPEPGIYGEVRKVVNHNPTESSIEITEKEDFLKALGIKQVQKDIVEASIEKASLSKNRVRKNELSHYFVILLLVFLGMEAFISYNLK